MKSNITAKNIVNSLKRVNLSQYRNISYFAFYGMELECFIVDQSGRAIDLTSPISQGVFAQLRANKKVARILWAIGTDFGRNMFEVAFKKFNNPVDFMKAMICLFDAISKDPIARKWRFVFGNNPDTSLGWIRENERYRVLYSIARKNGIDLIDQMASFASMQINICAEAFGGMFSPLAFECFKGLSNWAPAIARDVELSVNPLIDKQQGRDRISEVFADFVNKKNLARYIGKDYFYKDLKSVIISTPHVIIQKDGKWIPAPSESYPQKLSEANYSTNWPDLRSSGYNGPEKDRRFEFRPLDSMNPLTMFHVVNHFDGILRKIVKLAKKGEIIYQSETDWRRVRYKKDYNLARSFLNNVGIKPMVI